MRNEKAIFAAGCFWHVEELFRCLPGVISTRVGYTGGHFEHPTYEDVCSHTTGHAEAVEVSYDPDKVTYDRLLEVFWNNHNPTTPNRQGPDVGSNYRSAIFYTSDAQKEAAEKSRDQAQAKYSKPIVTEIAAVQAFWPAEEYHQQYLKKHNRSSCHL
jgi:peptide-methionine (S)-S-oxide reductase